MMMTKRQTKMETMMTNALSRPANSALWIALMTAASTVTTLIFACATPFPSLAAIAAVYLGRRDGVLLMLAAWGVSQAVGFGLMGYPHDAGTIMTALALGIAAVASFAGASMVARGPAPQGRLLMLPAAFIAGFIVFKATILLCSPVIGHTDVALSMPIMLRQFIRYAGILVVLVALYHALTAVGVPAPRRRAAAF